MNHVRNAVFLAAALLAAAGPLHGHASFAGHAGQAGRHDGGPVTAASRQDGPLRLAGGDPGQSGEARIEERVNVQTGKHGKDASANANSEVRAVAPAADETPDAADDAAAGKNVEQNGDGDEGDTRENRPPGPIPDASGPQDPAPPD